VRSDQELAAITSVAAVAVAAVVRSDQELATITSVDHELAIAIVVVATAGGQPVGTGTAR